MTNTLQLIEHSLLRGGRNLAAKDIAGTGRSAAATIASLLNEGLFEKQGTRYALTALARKRWESEAPPDRRQAVVNQAVESFLNVVSQRNGKALTAKELAKFDPAVVDETRRQGLIETGAKANSFVLSVKGQEFLTARLPLDEQLKHLQELHQRAQTALSALRERVAKDFGSISGELQIVAASAFDEANRHLAGLSQEIETLGEHGQLSQIAVKVRDEVARQCDQAVAWMDEQTKKLQDRQQQAICTLEDQQRPIVEQAQMIQARLDRVESQMSQLPAARHSQQPRDAANPLQGTEVQESILQHAREHDRADRDVPITLPDLLKRIRERVPEISLGAFHDAVRILYQSQRIRLLPFTRSLATIPDPNGAIFVDGEVMYYVRPS